MSIFRRRTFTGRSCFLERSTGRPCNGACRMRKHDILICFITAMSPPLRSWVLGQGSEADFGQWLAPGVVYPQMDMEVERFDCLKGHHMDIETVKARKWELVRCYTSPVQVRLALELGELKHVYLNDAILAEYTKQAIILIIKHVSVVRSPWNVRDVANEVEQVLQPFIAGLRINMLGDLAE